jgi:DNA-binding GntR family transcriptional regulator
LVIIHSNVPSGSFMMRPSGLAPLTPATLVARAVEAIVYAAATGLFLPGDRIVESELARQLKVSRVPVREALRLLESQGILVNTPYRGMRLMEVTPGRLCKILEVRLALERLAAFSLRARVPAEPLLLAPLDEISRKMRACAGSGDREGIARFETDFHRTLLELTGNEILVASWKPLACQLTIIFGLSTLQNDMLAIAGEHVELLQVIRSGTEEELERTLKEHILDSPQKIDFDAITFGHRSPRSARATAKQDSVERTRSELVLAVTENDEA